MGAMWCIQMACAHRTAIRCVTGPMLHLQPGMGYEAVVHIGIQEDRRGRSSLWRTVALQIPLLPHVLHEACTPLAAS